MSMPDRVQKDGTLVVDDGKVIRLYGPDRDKRNDKHFLGSIIKRGLFKSTSAMTPYGYSSSSSVTTSDSVFDILGPGGGMLVRGCITSTLWDHVARVLKPQKQLT